MISEANRVDRAWVAGIFEGEGSIHTNGYYNYLYPKVGIVSTDLDVIERVKEIVGFGKIRLYYKQKAHWKQAYAFEIMKESEVWIFIDAIYEWLGKRRCEQIKIVTKKCYTPPLRCIICNKLFKPGVDRRRGSITCSAHCSIKRNNQMRVQWGKRNPIRKKSQVRAT